MPQPLLLAIDQGTSSSRAMVFTPGGEIVAIAQQEFPQHYPAEGWVEHDPADLWSSVREVATTALAEAEAAGGRVISIGITNQRETTLLWDRATGRPLSRAIVWQDRRTAGWCQQARADGQETIVRQRTGLLLDPYFSATKIAWILDNVDGARAAAEKGGIAFGTVDTWLLWQLTGGVVHATDATNASRTNLLNLASGEWDTEMLRFFDVPEAILPEVRNCASDFGRTDPSVFGRSIPIGGIAGDQQAAAIGQGCFSAGSAKSTYGTGCFFLVQSGSSPALSEHGLLSTISYQLGGSRQYCLEGAIFTAGSGVKWLRDGIGVIDRAADTEAMALSIPHTGGVYVVPAFSGLGAPHWALEARGVISGLTQGTGRAEIVRAMLESVAFQTHDLVGAIRADGVAVTEIGIDGGMVANDWLCQFLADICDVPLRRPRNLETTALGAAALAGIEAGVVDGLEGVRQMNTADRDFTPDMGTGERASRLSGWRAAVEGALAAARRTG